MSPFISAYLRPTALATAILSVLPLMAKADDTSAMVSSSTVTLSNLRFELIDLNANDGVTPSVSFDLTGQLSISGPSASNTSSSTYSNTLLPSTPTTVVSDSGRSSITTTADSVTLKSVTTVQDLLSSTQPNFTTWPGNNYGYMGNNNRADLSVNNPQSIANNLTGLSFGQFTLSANTILRITGTASSNSSLDATGLLSAMQTGVSNPTLSINKYPDASAVGLALGKLNAIQNGDMITPTGLQGSLATMPVHPTLSVDQTNPTASDTQSQDFELVYTNLHNASETGDVSFSLSAINDLSVNWDYSLPDTGVPSIPEPATYALMGLGLVGITLARRRIAR